MEQYSGFGEIERSFTDRDRSRIAILPVPYDKTSTWIKGAAKGPFALLEASRELELYDMETDSEVYTRGIHTCAPLQTEAYPGEMVRQVEEKVLELLDSGKFVVTIGGEHSVSIGSVAAHSAKYGDLCALQLDAHSDLREEYKGSPYNHACTAARIKEICPLVQVGLRSMPVEDKGKLDTDDIFPARDIVHNEDRIDEAVGRLSENVYVTIDLDVFDPSVMPSTGTPQPGGLDWYRVTGLLKAVAEHKNVVGFDVVELCPNKTNKAPDFLAAKLVYKFLSYIFQNK
ncbi:MAG: agmatinase [Candidatus Omnitrophota bacterium]|nr:agmatinase [Candidatus Omnitrophota bacterium]